ncbi:MAG: hypothetical protein WBD30_13835, partial [Bacteroidota bacterium]
MRVIVYFTKAVRSSIGRSWFPSMRTLLCFSKKIPHSLFERGNLIDFNIFVTAQLQIHPCLEVFDPYERFMPHFEGFD